MSASPIIEIAHFIEYLLHDVQTKPTLARTIERGRCRVGRIECLAFVIQTNHKTTVLEVSFEIDRAIIAPGVSVSHYVARRFISGQLERTSYLRISRRSRQLRIGAPHKPSHPSEISQVTGNYGRDS